MVIVSGALGGIILTVAVILVVLMCRRRRRRNDKREAGEEKDGGGFPGMLTIKRTPPAASGKGLGSSGDSTGSDEKGTSR